MTSPMVVETPVTTVFNSSSTLIRMIRPHDPMRGLQYQLCDNAELIWFKHLSSATFISYVWHMDGVAIGTGVRECTTNDVWILLWKCE